MTNLKTSLFAGVLIAIAGWGFLANPVLGMFLFCVGLIAVVKYQTRLYTGTAGFLSSWRDLPSLLLILLGNIAGCLAVASVALVSPLPLGEAAIRTEHRGRTRGAHRRRVRRPQRNRLLFLCGFPHCVADAFYCCVYLFSASDIPWLSLAAYYGAIVLGNFIGCNIYRLFTIKKSES